MTHTGTATIDTQRLTLRRLKEGDDADLFTLLGDEQVVKFLYTPQLTDIGQARERIAFASKMYENLDYYHWGIELKETGRLIGAINLANIREIDESVEVGYSVARDCWGKGYMPEALKAVIRHALLVVGFNRFEAAHSTRNPSSGTVMRKVGMQYEGMMREKYKNLMGYHDTHQYAILKKDISGTNL